MSQAQATSTAHHQDFGRGTWSPPAGWLTRVAARLIDDLVQVVGTLPYVVGLVMLLGLQSSGATIYQSVDPGRQTDRVTVIAGLGLMGLGGILSLVIWIWNRVVHQGRTGQTIGKTAMQDAYGLAFAAIEPSPAPPGPGIPCARHIGQPMTRCEVTVVHTGGDSAVTVAWPDGGTRIITFHGGFPASSDSADEFRFTREGTLNMIRIGTSERFEITDQLALGE